MTHAIDAFLSEWTAAELTGMAETQSHLLTDDFYVVGPLGFVLTRAAWLARPQQGLAYEHVSLDEIHIGLQGDVTVVTARHNAFGTYQGRPLPESLRATLVVASCMKTPKLATIHMSFIAGTPGSPPLSPPADGAQSTAQYSGESS